MALFTCAACGNAFNAKPSLGQKHCSRKCGSGKPRVIAQRPCSQCGNTYKPTHNVPSAFCSRLCQVESWRKPRVLITCQQCGVPFEVNQYRATTAKFCSHACRAYARSVGKTIGVPAAVRTTRPTPYERPIYRKLASRVRKRDSYRCQMCSKQFAVGEYGLDVDHKVPIRLGGKDSLDNLWALCRSCHSKKDSALRKKERAALTTS